MAHNVLVVYHSGKSQTLMDKLLACLTTATNAGLVAVHTLTESGPSSLTHRADYVAKSDAVLIVVGREFQSSLTCMEIVHFVRDLKKPMWAISSGSGGGVGDALYVPFGALGAIICGTPAGLVRIHDDLAQTSDVLEPIVAAIRSRPSKGTPIVDTRFALFFFYFLVIISSSS